MANLGVMNLGNYGRRTGAGLIALGQQLASSYVRIETDERRSDNTAAGDWRGEQREIFFFPVNNLTGSGYARQYSALFFAASMEENLDPLDCFTIYINIMRLASPAKEQDFRGTLTSRGYTVCDLTTDQCRVLLHSMNIPLRILTDGQHLELGMGGEAIAALQEAERGNKNAVPVDSETLADEEVINNEALQALIGIYFNLITKKLTLQNITQWYKQRVKAYTKGAKTAESMTEFSKYQPNLQFAEGVTCSLAACHDIKRLILFMVRGLSTSYGHILCESAKTTMVYFKMAELTSFGMTLEWVLARNPVLLTWNGLAKHLPYLKAAVDKYRTLGADAPYCKLIFPPESLTEFKGDKIGFITNVAFNIAVFEGQVSLLNYRGTGTSSLTPAMSNTCRKIVAHFSGAMTHSVAASRSDVFHALDPKSMLAKLLNSPAQQDDGAEEESQGSVENVPVLAPLEVN